MLPSFYFILLYNQVLLEINLTVTLENRYDSLELSDKRNPQELENAGDIPGQSKQEPSLSDSMEPERPRGTGNYNLRKSLAWDSAFFTSKGLPMCT